MFPSKIFKYSGMKRRHYVRFNMGLSNSWNGSNRWYSKDNESAGNIPIGLEDIYIARQLIRETLKNTPLTRSVKFSSMIPGNNKIYLKYENYQLTGSYKERGVISKLSSLTEEEKEKGVVAASAGNHSLALAYHSQRLKIKCTVVMPILTPLAKVQGAENYGAEIILSGESLFASLEKAQEIHENTGMTFVHPFNDYKIIAGAGTLGVELMEQNPFLDAVIIPIGGGGLIAGTAMAMKEVNPRIKIYGVEAANMPGMRTSLQQRRPQQVPYIRTLADGIAVKSVGDYTYPIVEQYVDEVVTVTENEIAGAVLSLLETEKTMTEGAGACSMAALLSERLSLQKKNVCCVLTGGNIDVAVLREIIDRGLVNSGRLARVKISFPDAPGYLAKTLSILAELGCNVSDIRHERAFSNSPSIGLLVTTEITIQTRGLKHITQIKKVLSDNDYNFEFV